MKRQKRRARQASDRQLTVADEPMDQPMIIGEPSTPKEIGHETLAEEEISDYHEEEALAEVHICSDTAVELLATQIQGILLLIFYAFTPQGRACGIASLKEKQIPEIRQKGHALSTEFKTQKYYHYQPVPLPEQGILLFEKYLAYVRPQAVARSSCTANDPENFIFLNYDG